MRLTGSLTKRWALFCIACHFMSSQIMTVEARKRVNFKPAYMSSDDIISYFKSFFVKASSKDMINEQFYSPEDYAEDLYHKIDNLMPMEDYVKWLMKTKDITDKTNDRKISLLPKYAGFINSPCNPTSVFNQTLPKILKIWDGDKSIVTHELEQWQSRNEHVPIHQLCNRFRGLICALRQALNPDSDGGLTVISSQNSTCQCGGDPSIVGFFRTPVATHHQNFKEGLSYPDGCYIRPWRPCKHISAVDNLFKGSYEGWHGSLENQRRILAQMVFPVARTHRCKQGTYCLDMIPGMRKPVCWCNSNSEDEECKLQMKKSNGSSSYIPPLGSELMNIRKSFARLIIPAGNTRRACNPEYNAQVMQLANQAGMDPTETGSMEIMRKLAYSGRTIRICDFREALVCDPKSKTCKGNLNCGPGKVHLGKGICVSDNGYQCQSNEDCVQNARCTYFKEVSDSACVCETGYGDECHLQHKPFFGGRFLPMISGFQDEKYIKLQIQMNKVLESWEDSMKLTIGDRCDPGLDRDSMEVVEYFGSVYRYDKERGAALLVKARKVTRDSAGKLCRYTQFQRCDPMHGRCAPFVGKRIVSTTDSLGMQTLMVEIDGDMECSPRMPKIFQEMVTLMCRKGYTCELKGAKKYCVPDCNSPFAPREECSKLRGRAQVGDEGEEDKEDGKDDDKDKTAATPTTKPTTTPTTTPTTPTSTTGGGDKTTPASTTGGGDKTTPASTTGGGDKTTPASTTGGGDKTTPASTTGGGDKTTPTSTTVASSSTTVTPDTTPTSTMGSSSTTTSTAGKDTTTTGPSPPLEQSTSPPPTPATTPPPKDTGIGAPCTSRHDCDDEKFLECSTARTHEQSGTCVCIERLDLGQDKACHISFDDPCDQDAIDWLKLLGHDYGTSPGCLAGDCTDVNAHKFCRPANGDGSMFITGETLANLRGAGLGATDGACSVDAPHGIVYRTTMTITVSFTLWLYNNY